MPDLSSVPSGPVGRTCSAGSAVESIDAPSDAKSEGRYRQALRHYDRSLRALRAGAYPGLTERQYQSLLARLERDRLRVWLAHRTRRRRDGRSGAAYALRGRRVESGSHDQSGNLERRERAVSSRLT